MTPHTTGASPCCNNFPSAASHITNSNCFEYGEGRTDPVPLARIYSTARPKSSLCLSDVRQWIVEKQVGGRFAVPQNLTGRNWFALCPAELPGLNLQISVDTWPLHLDLLFLLKVFDKVGPLISVKLNASHGILIWGLTKELLMSSAHISWHSLLTFVLNEGFASQM